MASFVSIEFFPNRIRSIISDPDEMVSTRIHEVAVVVHRKSQTLIGSRYTGHHGGELLKNSGGVVKVGTGSDWGVRYDHPAAKLHHDGAKPHGISPVRAKYMYRSGPGVVTSSGSSTFGPRVDTVSHPGTKPNPYLANAARQVGLKSSMGSVAGQQEFLLSRLRGPTGRFLSFF